MSPGIPMSRKRPDLAERNRQNATHGMTGSRTFKTWDAMRYRCNNPQSKDYPNYGGRGIRVCDRWLNSFEAFLADMGERPSGMTLDRIDGDGDYCKENCRWATPLQQNRNRRSNVILEFQGDAGPISYWAEKVGLERKTLEYRIRVGWDVERALTTPSTIPRKRRK
jgi:hypothetical protein